MYYSGNANQFGSSPCVYKRQASSERMAGISTGATIYTSNNQLAVSNNIDAVLINATDQPTLYRHLIANTGTLIWML